MVAPLVKPSEKRHRLVPLDSRRYGIWEKIPTISQQSANLSPGPALTQVCRSMRSVPVTEASLRIACCKGTCTGSHTWEALGVNTGWLFLLPGERRGWRRCHWVLMAKRRPRRALPPAELSLLHIPKGICSWVFRPPMGGCCPSSPLQSTIWGALRWQKDERVGWTEKGREGCGGGGD